MNLFRNRSKSKERESHLDGGLQLDDPRAMSGLAQVDLKRVLHPVMMPLWFYGVPAFLIPRPRLEPLILRRSVLGGSSVPSVSVSVHLNHAKRAN